MDIKITDDFFKEAEKFINGEIKYYNERAPKMVDEVSKVVQRTITDNILNSRDVDGGRVHDNAPATVKFKGFNRPLFHTGFLARQVRNSPFEGGKKIFISNAKNKESDLTSAQVASNLQYGWQGNSKFVKPLGKGKFAIHYADVDVKPRHFFFDERGGLGTILDNEIDAVLGNLF